MICQHLYSDQATEACETTHHWITNFLAWPGWHLKDLSINMGPADWQTRPLVLAQEMTRRVASFRITQRDMRFSPSNPPLWGKGMREWEGRGRTGWGWGGQWWVSDPNRAALSRAVQITACALVAHCSGQGDCMGGNNHHHDNMILNSLHSHCGQSKYSVL